MSGDRFDEVELRNNPELIVETHESGPSIDDRHAPLWRRSLSLIVDLSLLAALIFGFKPLFPPSGSVAGWLALVAFLILFSLYYFVSSWMVWKRTLGAAILAIRIEAKDQTGVTFRRALKRWAGTVMAVATAGIGFLLALVPPHRSLPDRMSDTVVIRV